MHLGRNERKKEDKRKRLQTFSITFSLIPYNRSEQDSCHSAESALQLPAHLVGEGNPCSSTNSSIWVWVDSQGHLYTGVRRLLSLEKLCKALREAGRGTRDSSAGRNSTRAGTCCGHSSPSFSLHSPPHSSAVLWASTLPIQANTQEHTRGWKQVKIV